MVNKFLAFYRTRRSIKCLQEPNTGPSTEPPQSSPHPQHSSFRLCPYYPLSTLKSHSGPLPSGFLVTMLYTFFISPMLSACPGRQILLDLVNLIIFAEESKLRISSLCISLSLHLLPHIWFQIFCSSPWFFLRL
jgi:hypothetical protein